MLIGASLLLALLTVVNYRCGKSPLYPPVVWCFVWAINLLLLAAGAGGFYPVSWSGSVSTYVLGALCFSLGGAAALMLPMTRYVPGLRPAGAEVRVAEVRFIVRRALRVSLIGTIAFFPFYLEYLREMANLSDSGGNFWERMRRGTMLAENMPTGSPFQSAPLFVQLIAILALIAVYEEDGRWSRPTIVLAGLATFYELIGGSRSDLVMLLVGLIAVSYFKKHRLPLKALAALFALLLVVFAAFQIEMQKMGAKADAPLSYNLPVVVQNLEAYSVGSLVAFDQISNHPGFVSNAGMLDKFFLRLADRFGAGIIQPSQHLDFVNISSGTEVNTYTIYFAYIDFGAMGIAAAMVLLGLGMTMVFRYATRRYAFATIVFSAGLFAILMTGFSEEFFAQIGFCVKAFALVGLLYYILPAVHRAIALRHSRARVWASDAAE